MTSVLMIFIFVFAMHRGPVQWFFDMPFERGIRWHFNFTMFTLAYGIYHGFASIADERWRWGHAFDLKDYSFGVFMGGTILIGLVGVMFLTSLRKIRKCIYQWWVRIHLLLTVLTVVFAILHGATAVCAGVGLLVLDRLYGHVWQAQRKYRSISGEARVRQLPGDVVRVSFMKHEFKFKAGQHVNMCIPSVSKFEWHPYSISSGPADDYITIHVRVLGDWSKRLHEVAGRRDSIRIYIEGPIGGCGLDIEGDRYKVFALISGGIGVTPLQSIYRNLVEQAARGRDLKEVLFVWSVRDRFLIDSVYDLSYARKLPNILPTSFQPDNVTDAMEVSARRCSRSYDNQHSEDVNVNDSGETSEYTTTTSDVRTEPEHICEECEANVMRNVSNIFDLRFHLTRPRSREEFMEANIGPTEDVRLDFHRVDFLHAFDHLRDKTVAAGEKRVAVLTCGPDGFTRDVRRAAKQASKDGVKFDVHIEHFRW